MKPVLLAERIWYSVGRANLIRDVSISADAGECIALVGPNGAGKSTLLRTLSGELRPQRGRVTLQGRDVGTHTARSLALYRAVLSQHVAVGFSFTVAEIVEMGAGDAPKATSTDLVDCALQKVGLATMADRKFNTLSGGEQQRAHFARVLVQLAVGRMSGGGNVLLLDEPTASLDLRHQLDILNVTKQCAGEGTTVIAVLHDLNLAALFADKIIVLRAGEVANQGAPSATINESMLRAVFGIQGAFNRLPSNDMPAVLLHDAKIADMMGC